LTVEKSKLRLNKTFFFLLVCSVILYIGADWQTEICVINIYNGWETYAWICCLVQVSNWAAFDFWRLIRYLLVAYWVTLILSYKLKS